MTSTKKFLTLVASASLLLTSACAVRAQDPGPPPPPADTSYYVDGCGSFTGYSALMAKACNGTDLVLDASCSVDGGDLTSQKAAYGGWECEANWRDTNKGGQLCVHLKCGR